MTDIVELVVKIPQEVYKASQIIDAKHEHLIQMPLEVITNGKVLPKGHGKLIDEKEIDTVVNGVFSGYKCSPKFFLDVIHNQCIETVGADRTESEG